MRGVVWTHTTTCSQLVCLDVAVFSPTWRLGRYGKLPCHLWTPSTSATSLLTPPSAGTPLGDATARVSMSPCAR